MPERRPASGVPPSPSHVRRSPNGRRPLSPLPEADPSFYLQRDGPRGRTWKVGSPVHRARPKRHHRCGQRERQSPCPVISWVASPDPPPTKSERLVVLPGTSTGGRQHAELLPVRQRVTLVHRSFPRLPAAPAPPAGFSVSPPAAPGLRPCRAGTHPPAFTFHPSPPQEAGAPADTMPPVDRRLAGPPFAATLAGS